MVRGVALVLLLAAAAGWLGLVTPARRERDRARAEYAEARQERERLRSSLSGRGRSAGATATPSDAAAASRGLRLTLLRATQGLPVEAVEISVSGGTAARGQLSAQGAMAALLRVAERLVDPAAGVRVERVVLAPAGASRDVPDDAMRLMLDGTSVESGS